MRTGTIAFLTGIAIALLYPAPISFSVTLSLLSISAVMLLLRPLRIPLLIIIGYGWCALYANLQLSAQLPEQYEGLDLVVQGQIASPLQAHDTRIRFLFDVQNATSANVPVDFSGKIRISWYHFTEQPRPGDEWQLLVRLKRPHGFSNPGGFDYEGWLFRQGIVATGYIRKSADNHHITSNSCALSVACWRQYLAQQVDLLVTQPRQAGIIKALALGLRTDITPQDRELFRDTGTAHLMAISGLHIGLVAGLVYLIILKLWSSLPSLCLKLPAPKAAALFAIAVSVLYALLAGLSIPTQRALIMISVFMLVILRQRQYHYIDVLLVAALLINLIHPLSLSDAGFWLSFIAVAIIFYITQGRRGKMMALKKLIIMQLAIVTGMVPVMAIVFQQISLSAPLANLLIVPIMSVLLIPMAIAGVLLAPLAPSLAMPVLNLFAWLMQYLLLLLTQLSEFNHNIIYFPSMPIVLYLCIALGVVILLMPRHLPGRWLGLLAVLPLILYQVPKPSEQEFWFTLLDVGQGLSAVVRTRHHTLLYDTGARFSESFNVGNSVVLPYLRHQGIENLDMVVISHSDNDHIGGFTSIHRAMRVSQIISGEPDKLPKLNVSRCKTGMTWQWDGVEFQFLSPANTPSKRNNRSCVLKISSPAGSVMLTGDIERHMEQSLLQQQQAHLSSDVLVVPHHGSKSSSTTSFIQQVSPQYALVSAGYKNRFGHPHGDVVRRYQENDVMLMNTAHSGTVDFYFTLGKKPLTPVSYREIRQRWWHNFTAKSEHIM